MRDGRKRVIVIGGGFAGLNLVRHLDINLFDVTLVDRNNFHSFPPLYYQVASSGLDAASICFPFRRELRKRHGDRVKFNMGEVHDIDMEKRVVHTSIETLPFDILVIAAGTTNNYFGMEKLDEKVYTLKSTAQALRCRNDILSLLERASVAKTADERRRLLNFVVIGGGPAGVEIAGALGEMKRYILPREYPSIPQDDVTITIVEGTDKLLRTMSPQSSVSSTRELKQLMVCVKTGTVMKRYDRENDLVEFADGSTIPASMVIWTAGVTSVQFNWTGCETGFVGHANRLMTDTHCAIMGLKDVYALGDIALMEGDPNFPKGHPQLAQVAIQQGRLLARNLNLRESGKENKMKEFRYNDKGSMATVGRNRAVVDLKRFHFHGFVAWCVWMFIHLISILGMRNKLTVLLNWIWAYFNYSTSLRLIIHPSKLPLGDDLRYFGPDSDD